MMGKKSGVAARLRNRIGAHHVTTHYVAHNLELSVTVTIKEVPYYTPSLKTWYKVFSSSTFIQQRRAGRCHKAVSYLIKTGCVLVVLKLSDG